MSHNHYYPYTKTKSTLCTALVVVWFLFFAIRYEWIFQIYKTSPAAEELIEVDMASKGDMPETLPERSVQAPASASRPVDEEPVSSTPSVQTQKNGTYAVKVPPPRPKSADVAKKKTPPPAPAPKVLPRPLAEMPKHKPITAPEVPKALFKKQMDAPADQPTTPSVFSSGKQISLQAQAGRQGAPDGDKMSMSGQGIGVSRSLQNRGIVSVPRFQESFSHPGVVRVEIRVDKEGRSSYVRTMRTNVSDPQVLALIKAKVKELTFRPSSRPEEFGYIDFVLKITQ